VKERLYERALPLLADHQLAHWVEAASICDGIIKGLKHADWPLDPWGALERLMLLMVEPLQASAGRSSASATRLVLQA
jgi:DNA polymerase III subunit delta